MSLADPRGGRRGRPHRSKCFHFYAVFSKILGWRTSVGSWRSPRKILDPPSFYVMPCDVPVLHSVNLYHYPWCIGPHLPIPYGTRESPMTLDPAVSPCYWHLVAITGNLFNRVHLTTPSPHCYWHLVVTEAHMVGKLVVRILQDVSHNHLLESA